MREKRKKNISGAEEKFRNFQRRENILLNLRQRQKSWRASTRHKRKLNFPQVAASKKVLRQIESRASEQSQRKGIEQKQVGAEEKLM